MYKFIQPFERIKIALQRGINRKKIHSLDLITVFGKHAEKVQNELGIKDNKIPIKDILKDDLKSKCLWTHIQQATRKSVSELTVDEIEKILFEGSISTKEFLEIKPIKELDIFLSEDGTLKIPTHFWAEGIQKFNIMEVPSLSKAVRQASHVLENEEKELEINELVINEVDRIISLLPSLEKNPSVELQYQFIGWLAGIEGFLKTKRHFLKKESYDQLIGTEDSKGAFELLKQNNWPASSACLVAVKNRLNKRNKELKKEIQPKIERRAKSLANELKNLLDLNEKTLNKISQIYYETIFSSDFEKTAKKIFMELINPYLCDSRKLLIEHKNARSFLLKCARHLRDNNSAVAREELIEARNEIMKSYFRLFKN